MPPAWKHLRVSESDGHTVVRFNGLETLFWGEDSLREVREEWDSLALGNLVFDFERVNFTAPDHFLAGLISLYRRVRAAGGTIALQNLPRNMEELVRITNLNKIFELRQTGFVHLRVSENEGFSAVRFNDIQGIGYQCDNETLKSELLSLVGRNLVLDFDDVEFVPNGWFLGLLVLLHRKCGEAGRVLAVYNLAPHVMEHLRRNRLSTVFNIFKTDPEDM